MEVGDASNYSGILIQAEFGTKEEMGRGRALASSANCFLWDDQLWFVQGQYHLDQNSSAV